MRRILQMKKGRVPHNKTNAMRRSMEENKAATLNNQLRNKQKNPMFACIKAIK